MGDRTPHRPDSRHRRPPALFPSCAAELSELTKRSARSVDEPGLNPTTEDEADADRPELDEAGRHFRAEICVTSAS